MWLRSGRLPPGELATHPLDDRDGRVQMALQMALLAKKNIPRALIRALL